MRIHQTGTFNGYNDDLIGLAYYCPLYITRDLSASSVEITGVNFPIQGNIEIPSIINGKTVVSIGANAFANQQIVSLVIPASITSIGNNAFFGCDNVTNITIDNDNPIYKSDGNCIILKSDNTLVFGFKTSVIPNYVQKIGDYSFCGSGITSIIIPAGVTAIGDLAFKNCRNLTDITIPDSLSSIGNETFMYCENLRDVTIPNSVISIGYRAFYACGLTEITIPASVDYIGNSAFSGCTNLREVIIDKKHFDGGIIILGSGAFGSYNNLDYIMFPDIYTAQLYRVSSYWSEYADKIFSSTWGYPVFETDLDLEEYNPNPLGTEGRPELVIALDKDLRQLDVFTLVTLLPAHDTLLTLLYDRLLNIDEQGNLSWGLATDVCVEENYQIFTFTLRDEVVFQNGHALTPEHILWLIEEFSSLPGTAGYRIWSQVEHAEILDYNMIQLWLFAPNPDFLYELTLPIAGIICQDYDQPGNYLGTGAFMHYETIGEQIVLHRKEEWWAGIVPTQTITMMYVPHAQTRAIMMMNGLCDMAFGLSDEDIIIFEDDPEISIHMISFLQALMFNMSEEFLQNGLVRQAIAYAIDFAYLEDMAGLNSNSGTFWDDLRREHDYDPERAQKLLEEAGYPIGSIIPLNLICNALNYMPIVYNIQNTLSNIGIEITVVITDYELTPETVQGYELILTDIGLSFSATNDIQSVFNFMEYLNLGYYDEEGLLELASLEQNLQYRAFIYSSLLFNDLPMLSLGWGTNNIVFASRLEGLLFYPDGT